MWSVKFFWLYRHKEWKHETKPLHSLFHHNGIGRVKKGPGFLGYKDIKGVLNPNFRPFSFELRKNYGRFF